MPTSPNVCSYTTLAKTNNVKFYVFNNGFIFTKLFACSQAKFLHLFAEIHQKKMLKIHVAVWHHLSFSTPTAQLMQ